MTIAGIQYLRALAALAVVAFHAAHGAAFAHAGHRGVDVFFVISGFIVTYTTYGRVQRAGDTASARAFWQRRIVRIVPLYWLCTLISALVRLHYGPPPASLALDLLFIAHPHARFPGHCWPFLVPGWSLNYEVFFYLLFTLCMLTGRLHALLAAVLMSGLALIGSQIAVSGVARFYLAPFGAEFGLGIALALVHLRTRIRPTPRLACGLLAVCSAFLFSPHSNQQTSDALLAAGMVYGALYAFDDVRWPGVALLGDASYAIYLVHTEVVTFVRGFVLMPLSLADTGTFRGLAGMGIAIATAAGVGVAVHRSVEKPLQRYLHRTASRAHASPTV